MLHINLFKEIYVNLGDTIHDEAARVEAALKLTDRTLPMILAQQQQPEPEQTGEVRTKYVRQGREIVVVSPDDGTVKVPNPEFAAGWDEIIVEDAFEKPGGLKLDASGDDWAAGEEWAIDPYILADGTVNLEDDDA